MKRRWFEPFGRVLHVGNRRLFTEALPALRTSLCARNALQCLALNHEEFREYRIPFSRVVPREVPSLIRTTVVRPDEVKPLYTLPLLVGYALH